jgi:hypothetical protein
MDSEMNGRKILFRDVPTPKLTQIILGLEFCGFGSSIGFWVLGQFWIWWIWVLLALKIQIPKQNPNPPNPKLT